MTRMAYYKWILFVLTYVDTGSYLRLTTNLDQFLLPTHLNKHKELMQVTEGTLMPIFHDWPYARIEWVPCRPNQVGSGVRHGRVNWLKVDTKLIVTSMVHNIYELNVFETCTQMYNTLEKYFKITLKFMFISVFLNKTRGS